MQTYDPRIYAVGECVAHRGIAYGLVAPLFEQAKVCANHLANFGIARYTGSVTSTKLKVTGIDLFSAGNFMGGDGTDEIVLNDPSGGVYKKLVVKNDTLVGAVLYGDTADGAWYFQLVKDAQNIHEIRDHLMFGQNHLGDVGHKPATQGRHHARHAEVCGCNGVCKGTSSRRSRSRACSRSTTCASTPRRPAPAVPAPAWSSRSSPRPSAVPTRRPSSKDKPMCGCTDHSHGVVRQTIRERHLIDHPRTRCATWNGRRPTAAPACRPALNYYLISTWPGEAKDDPQSRFINERAHANIQKDGTYSVVPRMWGGLTTPAELRAIADVAEKYQVPTVKVTGGAAHRPARHQEGRPAQGLGRPRCRRAWSPATPTARASAP
jgi:nitrite reductase (NADH) large subunit